ncbi:M24 family metallopeptidase [Geomesophilobacter sediminis]|uniref:Aminopeptidase P family protein n=1 Tax=Geomesophilobacter sediminis TaxID=2798584 RepID=A0A8J7M1J7_9BACT|nr:Xaa-Pro peptidase family protein [Geomesophilobacter sediminis]MBJ6726774.1 aminopeptidase P family protein [Geomesophilobacter sediminis]
MLIRSESEARIARLQGELSAQGIDAALILHPIDIFYFSGTRQTSALLVPAAGAPVLWVRKSLSRAQEESAVTVLPFPSSRDFAQQLPEGIRTIGFTFDVLPVQQYNFYAKLLPGKEFVDISAINRDLRSVKSPYELELMRASGRRTCAVFAEVPQFLKPGMREVDLAAEFEYRLRRAGSEGLTRMRAFNQEIFMGLTVSGSRAEAPGFFDGAVTGRGLSAAAPHGASLAPIDRDVPIILDFTGIWDGYVVDVTRIFVLGKLSERLTHAYQTSLAIQQYLAEHLKPGVICEELFQAAAAMAEDAGLGRNFMGAPGENARFVGHGVGLELDEYPVLAQGFKVPLKAGQTIAIEPKFVIPGEGVLGIENTFAVTEQGGENLTQSSDEIVYL